MKTWLSKIMWTIAIFFAGMSTLFVLLILGVQYGDTYVGNDHPSFMAATKYVVKKALVEVKNGIYHGATVYNPAGDTIPDSWDNTIINEVKQVF